MAALKTHLQRAITSRADAIAKAKARNIRQRTIRSTSRALDAKALGGQAGSGPGTPPPAQKGSPA